jgi:hypothetical protein
MNKKYVSLTLGALATTAMIVPAFAQNTPTANNVMQDSNRMMRRGGEAKGNGQMVRQIVTGTVTGISGNTITLSGTQGMTSSTTPKTIFTIDATNAKVMKAGQDGALSAIVVGDTIAVSGTLSGTTITASTIRDARMMGRGEDMKRGGIDNDAKAMQELQGNGQPVVAGTITAITGTTLTLTNKSNVTYTAEVGTAKIIVKGATSTLTSVKVGDSIIIQGTVNGTIITATTVINNGAPKATTGQGQNQSRGGFFSSLGGFFGRMFGF